MPEEAVLHMDVVAREYRAELMRVVCGDCLVEQQVAIGLHDVRLGVLARVVFPMSTNGDKKRYGDSR